ncbi:hypothetical protein ACT80S_06795 [Ramlibacter sp. MAHUQ-53]|uniref:hypothetical protein n=1 Tax=unclassified Ramlibacter TaxID=2617605 RepID=UPI003630C172
MRLRSLLLVLATAAVVVFALLNWEEFNRPTPVNLVWGTATVPLPLLMLGLLALAVVAFVASGAAREAHHRRLERDQARVLQAQRELAERAEASRFTELRQVLETHLRDARHHEATAASALDQALARSLRDQRAQLEQLHRALASRLGEMEARVDARLARLEPALEAPLRPPQALYEPAEAPARREPAGQRLGEPDFRSEPVRPA